MSNPTPESESPWSNRTFVVLFGAHVASLVGTAVGSIALGLLARELVGADVTEVTGITMTIRIVVLVFFAPLAGRVSDLMGRKATMVAADLMRVLVVTGFFFVDEVWQIYALAVLLNFGAALFTPIYKSVIPGVTGEKAYPKALAAGTVAYDLSHILGPVAAGFLIAGIGFRGNFIVDAATFLLSALLILPLRFIGPSEENPEEKSKPKSDLLFGMRRMVVVPQLRHSLLFALRVSIVGGLALVATIGYVTTMPEETEHFVLGLPEEYFAWAMAALGCGSMLGVTIYAYASDGVQKSLERVILPGLAASLLIVAVLPYFWALLLAWVLSGAGQGIYNNMSNRLLAANSSETERPHIYAAHFSLSHLGWGLTYPAAGFFTSWFGFQTTAWIFLGMLGLTLIGQPWRTGTSPSS